MSGNPITDSSARAPALTGGSATVYWAPLSSSFRLISIAPGLSGLGTRVVNFVPSLSSPLSSVNCHFALATFFDESSVFNWLLDSSFGFALNKLFEPSMLMPAIRIKAKMTVVNSVLAALFKSSPTGIYANQAANVSFI